MEKKLKLKGVKVFSAFNCTRRRMLSVMKQYLRAIRRGDAAMVYLAGHGVVFRNFHRFLAVCENEDNPNFNDDSIQLLDLINRFAINAMLVLVLVFFNDTPA